MKDGETFRSKLAVTKQASVAHLLIRTARLMNEAGLRRVQADPQLFEARAAHLAVFPHLDLDGTRVTELARRMGVTKQAVSQVIDELEQMGIVERRPDPDDGRAKRVVFTDAGRAAILRGLSVLKSIEDEVLDALSPTRRKRLLEDLQTLDAALEHLNETG